LLRVASALAAVLAAGAAGARVGTRFVAAEEAGAHPEYVRALIDAKPQDTIYTEAYSVGWPDAPHRVLRSCVMAAEACTDEYVGEQRYHGEPFQIPRFSCLTIDQTTTGAIAAMPHWAGESVGGVTRIQSAAEIVDELVGEAEHLLQRWGEQASLVMHSESG
jgi:NAD(P)H-dependent flavin oxidoreductase YrpB (nitropropane dioxygenase family)